MSAARDARAVALAVLLLLPCAPAARAWNTGDPHALLERAIRAAGGAAALDEHPALTWRGRATVHTPDRRIDLEGHWRLLPPDLARVETWEAGTGPERGRTLIVSTQGGWGRRGEAKPEPLPAAFVAHERDQFYLYSVMRLTPLRDPEFRLTAAGPDAQGRAGLRAAHDGRPDVEMYFDADGRLARMATHIQEPGGKDDVLQELALSGVIEGSGIRWPRRIAITWDGRPYFDLELIDFRPARRLDPALFAP